MAEQRDETRVENDAHGSAKRAEPVYEAARDRNRRLLADRHTTDALREAIGNYLDACAEAQSAVKSRLQTLCKELQVALGSSLTSSIVAVLLERLPLQRMASLPIVAFIIVVFSSLLLLAFHELQAELRCLESAAQWTLLASTLVGHVASATGKGWTLPSLRPAGDCSRALEVKASHGACSPWMR